MNITSMKVLKNAQKCVFTRNTLTNKVDLHKIIMLI